MRRRILLVCGLGLLVFTAGCSLGGGGGEISEEKLTEEADYDWDASANTSYTLITGETFSLSSPDYRAVIEVTNQSTLEVFGERRFRDDTSLGVEALQFRFTNGTVVNATHGNLTAVEGSDETEIQLPAENGTVAFRDGRSGRSWSTPVYVDGSHQVTLPNGTRVGIPFLSRVSPGGYDTTLEDGRMTVRWDEIEGGSITIRYYLLRDLYIFGGIAVLGLLLGIGGLLYYVRQIRRAKEQRQDVGLDVEVDDDDVGDDGPPPGMR
jgi:hypothetical protein